MYSNNIGLLNVVVSDVQCVNKRIKTSRTSEHKSEWISKRKRCNVRKDGHNQQLFSVSMEHIATVENICLWLWFCFMHFSVYCKHVLKNIYTHILAQLQWNCIIKHGTKENKRTESHSIAEICLLVRFQSLSEAVELFHISQQLSSCNKFFFLFRFAQFCFIGVRSSLRNSIKKDTKI